LRPNVKINLVAKPTRSSDLMLRLDQCTPPLILNLGSRRKCLLNFSPLWVEDCELTYSKFIYNPAYTAQTAAPPSQFAAGYHKMSKLGATVAAMLATDGLGGQR
jgi:hypothetical protein